MSDYSRAVPRGDDYTLASRLALARLHLEPEPLQSVVAEIAATGQVGILRVLLAQTGILTVAVASEAADRDPWMDIADLSDEGRNEFQAACELLKAIAARMAGTRPDLPPPGGDRVLGWWNSAQDGTSPTPCETGLVWGDGPADVMDAALDEIAARFQQQWGRAPTIDELVAGVRFSASRLEGTTEDPGGGAVVAIAQPPRLNR